MWYRALRHHRDHAGPRLPAGRRGTRITPTLGRNLDLHRHLRLLPDALPALHPLPAGHRHRGSEGGAAEVGPALPRGTTRVRSPRPRCWATHRRSACPPPNPKLSDPMADAPSNAFTDYLAEFASAGDSTTPRRKCATPGFRTGTATRPFPSTAWTRRWAMKRSILSLFVLIGGATGNTRRSGLQFAPRSSSIPRWCRPSRRTSSPCPRFSRSCSN